MVRGLFEFVIGFISNCIDVGSLFSYLEGCWVILNESPTNKFVMTGGFVVLRFCGERLHLLGGAYFWFGNNETFI